MRKISDLRGNRLSVWTAWALPMLALAATSAACGHSKGVTMKEYAGEVPLRVDILPMAANLPPVCELYIGPVGPKVASDNWALTKDLSFAFKVKPGHYRIDYFGCRGEYFYQGGVADLDVSGPSQLLVVGQGAARMPAPSGFKQTVTQLGGDCGLVPPGKQCRKPTGECAGYICSGTAWACGPDETEVPLAPGACR